MPLAILFPETRFTAVDSIGKEDHRGARAVAEGAGIANLEARNCRAEQLAERFDYVVSRAVTDMATFTGWVWPLVERGRRGTLPNGILYLKGGDLTDELARTRQTWRGVPDLGIFSTKSFSKPKR